MKSSSRNVKTAGLILLASLASSTLSGCFPLAAGGMAAGTIIATDRRTTGAQTEDKAIELKSENRIHQQFGDKVHVNVNSYNRKVLVTGEVPSPEAKSTIEQLIASVENVNGITNELEIADGSSIKSRTSDTVITGKVKAALIDSKDIFASAYKITTERGVVYLQGRVTRHEGDRAAEEARTVGGVLKVVKVFEYITEEELQNIVRVKPAEDTKPGVR